MKQPNSSHPLSLRSPTNGGFLACSIFLAMWWPFRWVSFALVDELVRRFSAIIVDITDQSPPLSTFYQTTTTNQNPPLRLFTIIRRREPLHNNDVKYLQVHNIKRSVCRNFKKSMIGNSSSNTQPNKHRDIVTTYFSCSLNSAICLFLVSNNFFMVLNWLVSLNFLSSSALVLSNSPLTLNNSSWIKITYN